MGKKSGGNEARLARQDEQARQQRIREGTKRIGEIFEGGSPFGTGQLTGGGYDPSKKYYTSSGAEWTPKIAPAAPAAAPPGGGTSSGYVGGRDAVQPGGGGVYSASSNSGGGYQQTPRATAAPAAVNYGTPEEQFAAAMKAGLFSGVGKSTGAFSGDFFDKRRQAYVDYAMPQLQDQYKDAQRELTYSLARGGNLASSTNAVQTGDLSKLYGTNQQAIADKALGYSNEARTAVEDARSDLIKTLNATGDAEGAATGALNRASALSRPDTYSPLSQLFADFTSTLGTQAALERSEAMQGRNYAKYNTGLFTPGRVSVS